MGADGGTVPTRSDQVKVKKHSITLDPSEALRIRWSTCALSSLPLSLPICCDPFGNLLNLEAVLEALLNKSKVLKRRHGIRSKNDILKLNITVNPKYEESLSKVNSSNVKSGLTGPFICPISGLESTGNIRFVALKPCGHVLSERSLKNTSADQCPQCQVNIEQVVTLVPPLNQGRVEATHNERAGNDVKTKKVKPN